MMLRQLALWSSRRWMLLCSIAVVLAAFWRRRLKWLRRETPEVAGGSENQDLIETESKKGTARLRWWQELNQVKPELVLPDHLQNSEGLEVAAHQAVEAIAYERLKHGRDWLVRDSDYGAGGKVPTHGAIKEKVNPAFARCIQEVCQGDVMKCLADSKNIILVLDTPMYGTLRELVKMGPELRYCQQVVMPQADLHHYFEMVRNSEFYPGVRSQRLDHWLCANASVGFHCLGAFFDYECRLIGARSAKLCPAADVMRYFRFRYPAAPRSVFAITVGLEEPAPTPEDVDAFVKHEAQLNGYRAELKEIWKYRMATFLYIIHC